MFKSIPNWVAELRAHLNTCTAEEARELMAAREGVLLDVREPGECEAGAVAQALKIPRGVLEMKLPTVIEDPNTPLFVHCATGGRATFAAAQLVELGYLDVTVVTCPSGTVCEVFQ